MISNFRHNAIPAGSARKATKLFPVLVLIAALGCENTTVEAEIPVEEISSEVNRILELEDRLESVGELTRLLRRLPNTPEAAERAVEGFDTSFLDRGDLELVLVAEWWVRFDPDGAVAWSRSSWRANHPRISYAVLRSMARIDPQRAIDAYHSFNVSPDSYAIYLKPVIVGWFESRNPKLLEFIRSQPNSQLQQKALGTLARLQVQKLGPDGAIAWAETVTAEQGETFQRHILQRIASSIAELEPEIAADWVERLVKEAGASETLLRRVAGRWGRQDPLAAFAWLSRFPPTKHQQRAVSQTFSPWFARAPEEAEQWLLAQEEASGTWLAPATLVLSKKRARKAKADPEYAIDWEESLSLALRIQTPEERWAAVSHLCRVWILRDEATTLDWMNAHSVPALYQTKVTAVVGKEGMRPRGQKSPGPGA